MDDLIYLVCVCLKKESGGMDYDPAVNPAAEKPALLAGNDLIALQRENAEYISGLQQIVDTIIVPISLEKYNELTKEFDGLIKEVDEKLEEAAKSMADAYKVMGIDASAEDIKHSMMAQTACGSAGKVLNEQLEIVERASDYIIQNQNNENEDEDDGYEDDDDDDDCDCDDDYEDEEDEEDYDDEDEDDEDDCSDSYSGEEDD